MPNNKETILEVRVKVGPKNDPLSLSVSIPVSKTESKDICIEVWKHVHDAFRKAMESEGPSLLNPGKPIE